MNGRTISALVLVGALALAAPALAREKLLPLTPACETALALSAAPDYVQEEAGVYVLGENGYELQRKSANGFHCLVERNHPDSIIPKCFDAASRDANLKVILDEGRLLRGGKSFAELREHREKVLANGEYPTPGPGLVYMVSDYNYIYNPAREAMIKVAPHVMYHAPNVTDADIGSKPGAALQNRGLPFINATGPHGFMIGFTEKPSESPGVTDACTGQLPDTSKMRPFPR